MGGIDEEDLGIRSLPPNEEKQDASFGDGDPIEPGVDKMRQTGGVVFHRHTWDVSYYFVSHEATAVEYSLDKALRHPYLKNTDYFIKILTKNWLSVGCVRCGVV